MAYRYQVVYGKEQATTTYFDTEEQARSFAAKFRSQGYRVDIWLNNQQGSRPLDVGILKDL